MTYTFSDMPGFVAKAARFVAHRYRSYVEEDDVSQEIYVWLYGAGQLKVDRWLQSDPQQTTRIYLSMLDVARQYAEREKAAKSGYRPEDVWWYTPGSLEALMPLAMDASYTQQNGHVGELLTMVLDIRKAVVDAGLFEFFTDEAEEHPDYRVNILLVLDRLGGERPAVGRRRAMSNAKAQAITSEQA